LTWHLKMKVGGGDGRRFHSEMILMWDASHNCREHLFWSLLLSL
jgi:hypothetical protein